MGRQGRGPRRVRMPEAMSSVLLAGQRGPPESEVAAVGPGGRRGEARALLGWHCWWGGLRRGGGWETRAGRALRDITVTLQGPNGDYEESWVFNKVAGVLGVCYTSGRRDGEQHAARTPAGRGNGQQPGGRPRISTCFWGTRTSHSDSGEVDDPRGENAWLHPHPHPGAEPRFRVWVWEHFCRGQGCRCLRDLGWASTAV